jgi:hypothetical protein
MEIADEPRRLTALQLLLLAALFVGLALLFARLLRPLAAAEEAAPVAAAAMPAMPEPVAAPPADVPVEAPRPAAAEAAEVAPSTPPPPAPFAPAFKGPRIAIVLTDVGDNPAQARAAIAALPPAVGLAFTPYPDVRALVRSAKADGHEVIAGLPMQPKAWPRVSPGKNTLVVGATPEENLRRLEWALARVEGASGVTGIMGSAFTESAASMRPVLGAVGARGLAYLDARASARSVGVATARDAQVRAAANDRFLDESGSIATQLAALEAQAKREGSAIGYARPLPDTIAALQGWSATLGDKGLLLVPPSSLAR